MLKSDNNAIAPETNITVAASSAAVINRGTIAS
jgi:hypothetical protein